MSTNMPDFKTDPNVMALAPVAANIRQFAAGLVIKSQKAYSDAANILKSIKGSIMQIEDARTRITKPLNESLKEVNAQAKSAAAPFLADEAVIKNAMIRYSDEQDREREEEQRKANEAAETERRRLQAIADAAATKARLEAEEKRRQAEQEAADGRQAEAQRLREAAERVEATAAAKVERFQDRANQVVAPIATQQAPKVSGVSVPMVWDYEIINENEIPREYCEVSTKRIRAQVQATKGMTKIPGVRVFQTKRIAAATA